MDAGTLKIIKKQDEFIFTNPGSLKLSVEEIFKGGNSKSRNPNMQLMLRMIGFGDNAGSGIPTILSAWKQEDWVEPNLYEDTHLNQVTLTLKTLATWTESVDELQDSIVSLPSVPEESLKAMRNALSIYNLGISPEARANMTEVASAISNAMKTFNQLDFSGLYEAVSRFAEMSKVVQPASENTRKLAALISENLKTSIESANKSADSDEKSANKSADSDEKSANKSADSDEKSANKSADSDTKSADSINELTKRQKQILTIMEDGEEHTTETIAETIGLKGPRTRQILNELVKLGKLESLDEMIEEAGLGQKLLDAFSLDHNKMLGNLSENEPIIWKAGVNKYRFELRPIILLDDDTVCISYQALDQAIQIWMSLFANGGVAYSDSKDLFTEGEEKRNSELSDRLVRMIVSILQEKYTENLCEIDVDYKRIFGQKDMDYGDYDVIFYAKDKKELFLIESKYFSDSLNNSGHINDFDKMFRDNGYYDHCRKRCDLAIEHPEDVKKFIGVNESINVHFLFVSSKPLEVEMQDDDGVVSIVPLCIFEQYLDAKLIAEDGTEVVRPTMRI